MVSIEYEGRLGNNLIQHIVGLFFSKKNNLMFKPNVPVVLSKLLNFYKIPHQVEGFIGNETVLVNDDDFLTWLSRDLVEIKHYHFKGYFQDKCFFQESQHDIMNLFDLKINLMSENDVFVHYRIGDVIDDRRMLPYDYYQEALSRLGCAKGFISSDSPNHKNCQRLAKEFNLNFLYANEIDTLDFGKNFNNIVLSEGTFSWWIGYLSKAKNIICNQRDYKWHGELNLDRWIKLYWDYHVGTNCNQTFLEYYLPIKLK